MADEKRPSGPPGGKRRRPPTTVDGKATEIWDLSEVGPGTDEFFDSLPGS